METETKQPEEQKSAPAKPGYGLAVASFVLGICALACICCFWLAILLGVMAVVFGLIGWKYGLGKAGAILGFLAVGIYVAAFVKTSLEPPTDATSQKETPSVEVKAETSTVPTQKQVSTSSEVTPEERAQAEAAAKELMDKMGANLIDSFAHSITTQVENVAQETVKEIESSVKEMESSLKKLDATMKMFEAFSE